MPKINIATTCLQALAELVRSGNDDVKIGALETLGNLAFQPQNRAAFLADADLLEWISRLARDQVRSEGGALIDLRRCVVHDALDMHVCLCWLIIPSSYADLCKGVQLHTIPAGSPCRLLEPLLDADCLQLSGVCAADMLTQTRLAPSFSCAADAEALHFAPSAGGRLEEEGECGGHQGFGNTRAE